MKEKPVRGMKEVQKLGEQRIYSIQKTGYSQGCVKAIISNLFFLCVECDVECCSFTTADGVSQI